MMFLVKLQVRLVKPMVANSKKGQATVEYIVLIASIVMVLNLGLSQLRDVLYGWDGNKGSIELIFEHEIDLVKTTAW